MIRLWLDTLWRLPLVQGSRNARLFDGLGFLHVMLPAIRRAAPPGERRAALVRRYAGYFNASPLMAPYIAGALARMELDGSARGADPERVERVRAALSSALTARGEHLAEVILHPLALTIGCLCAMYSWYIGPVAFLLLHNLYNCMVRTGGYRTGLHLGEQTGRILAAGPFGRQRMLGGLAAFAAGLFAAFSVAHALRFGGARVAGSGLALIALSALLGRRLSALSAAALLLAAAGIYLAVW
ncbi:MAG: PTS system mannose/fructose/sorbose family transporter subunit IID [Candidatus Krumholzibacteria bacterium]|nr:PTS system mannose/fructose/sorbose family transporter subunit IID [Candidatus Krumholzibacteria bacterium]